MNQIDPRDLFEVFKDEAGNVWQAVSCKEIQYVIDEEDELRFRNLAKRKYFKIPPVEIIQEEEVYLLDYDEF